MRRLLALLAVGAAALFVLASAQGGAFPGTNGLIAFTCGSAICTAASDGTVYGSPLLYAATNPSWSEDGTKLAYQSGSDIYVASSDGTSPALFTTGASDPSWSPDNDTIAFVSGGNIWTRSSSSERQLTADSATDADPAFSHDGSEIAYSSGGTLYTVPATGGGGTSLGIAGDAPSWAPFGSTIVFSSGSLLYTLALTTPASPPVSLGVSGTDPAYSPDGSKIAYTSLATGSAGQLWVVDADGTNAHAVNTFFTSTSQADWGGVQPPSSPGGNSGNGPVNVSYPTITPASGDSTPIVGHVLTAGVGSWSGSFPIAYGYQWKRCDAADPVNGSCFDIRGATSSFYTPTAADYGMRLRVAVTASNSDGSTSQNSEVTDPVGAIATKVTSTPVVSPGGTPTVDSTLTLSAGVWAGSTPMTFTYSWRRCDPVGDPATCVPIVGATAATYTPTIADIGFSLRVWITGTNLIGSDVAITNHTYPVVDKSHFAPTVVTRPAVGGTALPGRQLTADVGTYAGDSPIATPFHWYRCDANGSDCHAIPGATKVVYHPAGRDVGYTLRIYVFAANAYGKLLALSDPTDAVAAAPPRVRGRRIVGTAHADYLAGGGHDDIIIGLAGNDTLLGGAGDDLILGGPGNDVITPGAGADRVDAGPGSDWIDAVDGERDIIDCGPGDDHAVVDPVDIVRNCEVVVRRTPPAPPSP